MKDDPLRGKRWKPGDESDPQGWKPDPTDEKFSIKDCGRCGKQLMRGPSGGIFHTKTEDAIACFGAQ